MSSQDPLVPSQASQNIPPPSRTYTPASVESTDEQTTTGLPAYPYPYLRQLYVTQQPTGPTNFNAEDATILWREIHSALDTIEQLQASSRASAAQVGDLQQELDRVRADELMLYSKQNDLEQKVASLQQQLQQAQRHEQEATSLRQQLQQARTYAPPVLSNEHPDPKPFDGSDISLLPDFILQMAVKLKVNADRYPNRITRIAYFVSRLASKALDQVKFGITETGDFTFQDVNELVQILRTAYGDAAPRATAGVTVLKLKQHKQPLQQFLPEWHRTAHESGFDDVALIAILKDALHFMILERLSYTPASFSTTSLPEFLAMVRDADSTLRMLYPNYHKNTPMTHGHSATSAKPTPALPLPNSLPPTSTLTTSDGGDAMDLSVVWTGSMGGKRRPKNDAERKARREYCFKNNLCLFCESPQHRIDVCPTRPESSKQPRQVATVATVETEN